MSVSDDALGVYSFKVFIDSGKLKIGVMRNEYSEVTMIKVYRDYRIIQTHKIYKVGNIATIYFIGNRKHRYLYTIERFWDFIELTKVFSIRYGNIDTSIYIGIWKHRHLT